MEMKGLKQTSSEKAPGNLSVGMKGLKQMKLKSIREPVSGNERVKADEVKKRSGNLSVGMERRTDKQQQFFFMQLALRQASSGSLKTKMISVFLLSQVFAAQTLRMLFLLKSLWIASLMS